jgi:hypothetical protein
MERCYVAQSSMSLQTFWHNLGGFHHSFFTLSDCWTLSAICWGDFVTVDECITVTEVYQRNPGVTGLL